MGFPDEAAGSSHGGPNILFGAPTEEDKGSSEPGLMQKLRTATDLALRVTKVTVRALGQTMFTLEVQEWLWLNLTEMKEANKVRFLKVPISQDGLFGDTVLEFAQQFSAVQKLMEAIKPILGLTLSLPKGVPLQHPHVLWCDPSSSQHPGCNVELPAERQLSLPSQLPLKPSKRPSLLLPRRW